MINMGVEPFLLASAMKMVISQRLGKRLCQHCKKPEVMSDIKQAKVIKYLDNIMDKQEVEKITFYHGEWCDKCHWTWYKGRLGIHEVLIIEDYLEPMILAEDSANNMAKAAVQNGMITIVQDGILKAALWDTTLEEAFKLV